MHRHVILAAALACLAGAATAQPTSTQTADLPKPTDAMKECQNGVAGIWCLYQCADKGQNITCMLVHTRTDSGVWTYKIDPNEVKNTKFVDNFREDHPALRAYYFTGRKRPVGEMTLGKGEYLILVEEFGGGANDIASGRIVFPNGFSLSGPVDNVR